MTNLHSILTAIQYYSLSSQHIIMQQESKTQMNTFDTSPILHSVYRVGFYIMYTLKS